MRSAETTHRRDRVCTYSMLCWRLPCAARLVVPEAAFAYPLVIPLEAMRTRCAMVLACGLLVSSSAADVAGRAGVLFPALYLVWRRRMKRLAGWLGLVVVGGLLSS